MQQYVHYKRVHGLLQIWSARSLLLTGESSLLQNHQNAKATSSLFICKIVVWKIFLCTLWYNQKLERFINSTWAVDRTSWYLIYLWINISQLKKLNTEKLNPEDILMMIMSHGQQKGVGWWMMMDVEGEDVVITANDVTLDSKWWWWRRCHMYEELMKMMMKMIMMMMIMSHGWGVDEDIRPLPCWSAACC